MLGIRNVSQDWGQGGRQQKNIGRAVHSNDDVIIFVTSLLLKNLAKILGGLQPTQPTGQLPPWFICTKKIQNPQLWPFSP